MALQTGTIISGAYELLEHVGSGGFGDVWRARARASGQIVAIKFLTDLSGDAARRFELELRVMARLDHPGCLRPLDHGTTADGQRYLVSEFIDGVTLAEWAAQPRSPSARLDVVAQIAAVLEAAHREGILHRDLKPSNVLIRETGARPVATVLDFGIAKLVDRPTADITKTGEVIGTVGYMSPEQLRGQRDIGPASDMYLLGVIAYELLAGQPVFVGDSPIEIAMQHLRAAPPPLPPPVAGPVAELVARLLDKSPQARPTAVQALRALAPSASVAPASPASPRVRPSAAIAATAAAALAVTALVIAGSRSDAPTPPSRPRNLGALASPAAAPAKPPEETPARETTSPAAAGCASYAKRGAGLRRTGLLEDGPLVYIPRGYTPARRYPVIVFFHAIFQPPEIAVRNIDFDAPGADEYVWIIPRGNPNALDQHWVEPGLLPAVLADVQDVAAEVCIDSAQLFVLGHGYGGRAVDDLPCSGVHPVAVATFGHRRFRDAELCDPRRPTPTLAFLPTEDDLAPAKGGMGCIRGDLASIDEHITSLRQENRCTDGEVQLDELCQTASCEAATTYCRIPGGRLLAVLPNNWGLLGAQNRGCKLETSAFPFTARALEFFATVRKTASPQSAP